MVIQILSFNGVTFEIKILNQTCEFFLYQDRLDEWKNDDFIVIASAVMTD